jgi:hypothetical protein
MIDKKIPSVLAIGIILIIAILAGGFIWLGSKQQVSQTQVSPTPSIVQSDKNTISASHTSTNEVKDFTPETTNSNIKNDAENMTPETTLLNIANNLRDHNYTEALKGFSQSETNKEAIMGYDNDMANRVADFFANARLVSEATDYRAYNSNFDLNGKVYDKEFIMTKNSDGAWIVISW